MVELVGSMGERRVLVAGCGSVGSRIAEDLARSGVRHFVLVDPDEVSLPNMARSVYARADVGRAKVAVLAERLRGIAPETEVSRRAGSCARSLRRTSSTASTWWSWLPTT